MTDNSAARVHGLLVMAFWRGSVINMAATELRVFLSHTSELQEFPAGRSFVDAAKDAVIRAGGTPIDMKYFTAREGRPAAYCRQKVEDANVYVGIIGFRYGSPVKDDPERSYVELEFDAATDKNLPRLVFLLDDEAPSLPLPQPYLVDPDHGDRQRDFRARVKGAGIIVQQVDMPEKLEMLLSQALMDLRQDTATKRSAEQSTAPGPVTALLPLAKIAQQRLQDALAALRPAESAMDRVERRSAVPAGMDIWEYTDQEAIHERRAALMREPAEDLEARSEQAIQVVREAEDQIRQLRASGFTQLPGLLAPMIETVSELERMAGELRERTAWSLDDLDARKDICTGYSIPYETLSRAYEHVKNVSSYATSMRKGLARLQAVPEPGMTPAARQTTPQPNRRAAPSQRTGTTEEEVGNVPVGGKAAAGKPILLTDEDAESVPVPARYARRDKVYAVRVKGDSMSGDGMLDGDYVIVDPGQRPENGDIVVVRIGQQDDAEAIIKRQRLQDDGTIDYLESSNPDPDPRYAPIPFEPQNHVVAGKVIGIFHPVN